MPNSSRYLDTVFKYSYQYGLEPEEVAALIQHESGWDRYAISKKGALGMMQINPYVHNITNPFDPDENIRYGTKYIGSLKDKYNNFGIAVAAYNAGPTEIDSWLSYRWDGNANTIPIKETRDLVERVTSTLREIRSL